MKRMDKTGQQMTLGTIIAIVLGVAVLVLLIWGFSSGWNNLWDKVTKYGGGKENAGTVAQACALSCSSKNVYGFCNKEITVNYGDGTWEKGSCLDLVQSKKIGVEACNIECDRVAKVLINEKTQA